MLSSQGVRTKLYVGSRPLCKSKRVLFWPHIAQCNCDHKSPAVLICLCQFSSVTALSELVIPPPSSFPVRRHQEALIKDGVADGSEAAVLVAKGAFNRTDVPMMMCG